MQKVPLASDEKILSNYTVPNIWNESYWYMIKKKVQIEDVNSKKEDRRRHLEEN